MTTSSGCGPTPSGTRLRRWSVTVAAISLAAVVGGACSSDSDSASAPVPDAVGSSVAMSHDDAPQPEAAPDAAVKDQLARARRATTRYATDLDAARADGYRIITPMMPDMGFHFMNPAVTDFDVERPPILVYVQDRDAWQLVALEWVFPEEPATPPVEGATYGSFAAACHYGDGTFVASEDETSCAPTSPETASSFEFWHPQLVTMHVWLWYPNPDGLFSSTNPLVSPFNQPDGRVRPSLAARLEGWHTAHGA